MSAKNQSNNERTVKSTLRVIPADFWIIDNVTTFCNYKGSVVLPDGFILDEFRDYFENFLEDVDVPESFYYSPTLFSEVQYGTPDLDFLVLYFAKIPSMFEFNQPKIKFLPLTSLLDLNKLIVEYRTKVQSLKKNPTEYPEISEIELPRRGFL
jgi:hypothetical protein